MNNLPGEKEEFLQINENLHNDSILDKVKYRTLLRHDTESVVFDTNGRAYRGKQDMFSKSLQRISKSADKLPKFITDQIGYVAASIFNKIAYEDENGKVKFKSPFSNKGKNRLYKDNNLQIKCGDLLNDFVTCFKDGAKAIEGTVKENIYKISTKGKKGRFDVMYAAENNISFNRNEFNNVISTFKDQTKNNERSSLDR